MDGDVFHLDKSLLNPKFEGYKLHILSQENAVLQFPLVHRPSQASRPGKTPLSFREVQSRITHNHLAIHNESGRAAYVDADDNVILIELDRDRLKPSIHKIFEFPRLIRSDAADRGTHREYPSVLFITSTSLLASDGQGTMYALDLHAPSQNGGATLAGTFVLPSTDSETSDLPHRIHHVHQLSPLHVIATLSSRFYSSFSQEPVSGKHQSPVEFDVWGVKIDLSDVHAVNTSIPVEILWHRRGEDVPMYVTFDGNLGLHLLLGGSEYHELGSPPLPTYEPTLDEMVPIPRADESSSSPNPLQRPPPYSWTQTSDSVTIAIPLPSTAPKDNIKVFFSVQTLTFNADLDPSIQMPLGTSLPRYSAKKLWDRISPSSSFWTFDRQAERTYGVVSLHLEKQSDSMKWSHVFAGAGTDSGAEEDIDVPETLDPSELWNIREALEKYTAALQGEDSGLNLGKGVPSLAENEMDEEVDSSVGMRIFSTWVYDPSCQNSQPEFLARPQCSSPFQLLSFPIPGHTGHPLSLIVKSNIDGSLFALKSDMSRSSEPPEWKHIATYPALAFVLASKRDTRFTHHIPGQAVYAFESGSNNRGGNVYIYYPTGPKASTAKQSILKINDGHGGALMGVGTFVDRDGKPIIACLTEGELTLIRNV